MGDNSPPRIEIEEKGDHLLQMKDLDQETEKERNVMKMKAKDFMTKDLALNPERKPKDGLKMGIGNYKKTIFVETDIETIFITEVAI